MWKEDISRSLQFLKKAKELGLMDTISLCTLFHVDCKRSNCSMSQQHRYAARTLKQSTKNSCCWSVVKVTNKQRQTMEADASFFRLGKMSRMEGDVCAIDSVSFKERRLRLLKFGKQSYVRTEQDKGKFSKIFLLFSRSGTPTP